MTMLTLTDTAEIPVPIEYDSRVSEDLTARCCAALERVRALEAQVRELTGQGEPDGDEVYDQLHSEIDCLFGEVAARHEDHGARRAGMVIASVLGLELAPRSAS